MSKDGDAGLELSSVPLTISRESGLCSPKLKGSVGAEPFTAKMRYTGNKKTISLLTIFQNFIHRKKCITEPTKI